MRIAVSAPARMDRSSRRGPTIRSTFPTIPASLLGAPRCQREERLYAELGHRNRSTMNSAEIAAAYLDDREDELLDAVGTAPALVGAAESVERCELLDFF